MASEDETLENTATVAEEEKVAEEVEEEEEVETGAKDEEDKAEEVEEEDDEEEGDDEEGEEEEEEEEKEEESKSKGKRGLKGGARKDESASKKLKTDLSAKEPVTPTERGRPSRERKTVERFSESSGKVSSGKPFSIEKGQGTPLKDIPNVAYKLSKKKPDDNLHMLHGVLFGKRAKAHLLKKNIGLFSGYVWVESEQEKQRAKVKDKLDKCVKEKLIEFCDILNIQISNRSSTKKEELSAKLLEFLESPHATTDTLLAEKEEKAKKRKGKTSRSKSGEKLKQSSKSGEKRKRSSKIKEVVDDDVEPSENGNGSQQDDGDEDPNTDIHEEENKSEESEDNKPEEESEEEKEPEKQVPVQKNSSKTSAKKNSRGKTGEESKSGEKSNPSKSAKSTKKSSSSALKKGSDDAEGASGSASKSKVSSTKKEKAVKESKKDQTSSAKDKSSGKKQSTKSSGTVSAKDQGKGNSSKKAKAEPTKEEMHAVVETILKEVDFNTATLSDILKQLGKHFGMDLLHRKAEVKEIITDVINNMSEDDDENEESEGSEGEKRDEDDDRKDS